VDFNDNAQIDSSQVEDRRGQSGGGGGILSGLPGGLATAGGGGLGIVGIIVVVLIQVLGGGAGGSDFSATDPDPSGTGAVQVSTCKTGADANARADCRITAIANSVQSYWTVELPKHKVAYTESDTVIFTSSTSSGCGQASSDMGPFYCPTDRKVYLDLAFFGDMLQNQLGAEGGSFAEAYVIAHEYGHHIQDLLGTMATAQRQGATGATSGSVRLELQADCYAGVWGNHATTTPDASGNTLISNLTQDDVNRAIDAAEAVGDDRIQQQSQGSVNPEQWTHGSAAERKKWFTAGFQSGDMTKCDTFSGSIS
jgi:predicted metalloprotease